MLKRVSVSRRLRQRGLSLVELMVSIVIGLLILAGVVQVVFTSKATFLAQEDMSYIQENARYAMSVLGTDIRGAGYWGCTSANPRTANVVEITDTTAAGQDAEMLVGSVGIQGFSDSTAQFPVVATDNYTRWPLPGSGHETESFIVRYAAGTPWGVVNDSSVDSFMQVQGAVNDPEFELGDFLVATAADCKSIGIFHAAGQTGGELGGLKVQTISYATGGLNCTSRIKLGVSDKSMTCAAPLPGGTTLYEPGSTLTKFLAHGYFIESSDVLQGQPALKRKVLTSTGSSRKEEIAVGVEDMLLMYGVQTGNNVQYKAADEVLATEWASVVSVQVNLLFRSQSQSLPQASNNNYLGNVYSDRYLRQVVTSTFKLRNRT